jgi:two-component system catabolic regulation response regulator CreB
VARVRARLRRARTDAQSGWRRVGAFEIDPDGHRVRYHAQPLELTRYELALLMALLQRPGAVLTRAQLLDRAWDDGDSSDRTIDTHVKTLRAKLRAVSAEPDPIRTHRGIGYSMAV